MIPKEYSREIIEQLPDDQRQSRIRDLETFLNGFLAGIADLMEWQACLYKLIDELNECGYFLGPWDYDSEIEIWGGPSYMDRNKEDDLLLKSEFPKGVKLAWKEFDDLNKE